MSVGDVIIAALVAAGTVSVAEATAPAWENLTALAVVLAAFGLLLKWVLSTLTAKLNEIVVSLSALVQSTASLVTAHATSIGDFRMRHERISAEHQEHLKALQAVGAELQQLSHEHRDRIGVLHDLRDSIHALAEKVSSA